MGIPRDAAVEDIEFADDDDEEEDEEVKPE